MGEKLNWWINVMRLWVRFYAVVIPNFLRSVLLWLIAS